MTGVPLQRMECGEAERLLKGLKGISFSYFTSKDVVRHPLVQRIVEAYDTFEAAEEQQESERREKRQAEREARMAALNAQSNVPPASTPPGGSQ